MAVFNSFTFDNENSLDYGVYITGEAVHNAPERAVEMVSIPGKNGALALDQGRFENIEVTYPAGTFGAEQAEFAGRMRAMRNMLASRYNYVRLTDSYHPDEYRLGLYKSGLEATPVAMSTAGEFDITFNCKPQRFLTSGEEPVDTSELGGEVTTEKIPYLLRRSGGGNIGHDFDAEIDKIIGGTVAWNQLCTIENFTATAQSDTSTSQNDVPLIVGHKYLATYKQLTDLTSITRNTLQYRLSGASVVYQSTASNRNLSKGFYYWLFTPSETGMAEFSMWVHTPNVDTSYSDYQLIDLTALFGSAEIADYVYSLEQTTSGSGVAWLKSHGFIDGSYRAYDSDSLQSVKTSEHRTSGKNLLPTFRSNTQNGVTFTVNSDGTVTANGTASANAQVAVTIPTNLTGDFYFTGCPSGGSAGTYDVYIWDVTINARCKKWDGITNISSDFGGTHQQVKFVGHTAQFTLRVMAGQTVNNLVFKPMLVRSDVTDFTYEPYHINSYPLDPNLELRGLFKLDANNNLYADGDVYESSGAVTRKYGIVDLGTLTWDRLGNSRFETKIDAFKYETDLYKISNLICSKYVTHAGIDSQHMDKGINSYYAGPWVQIRDTSHTDTSAADFKTAMSGVYLVYELATPTTEQADPYANPQVVNPLGTEEYVDTRDVPVPVGHETKYGMSQLILTNPTEFPSKPLLEVTGVGTFWLGDTQFTITGTAGQTIYIDCETGEAWKNVGGVITPANGLVTLNRLDFPELDPGDTPVMYGTGITKVVVTPRWWII